jgi:hypothetical protein
LIEVTVPVEPKGGKAMSLQVKLEALAASLEATGGVKRPTVDGAMARLVSEEETARPLKVGDFAPAFTLPAYGGARASSAEFLKGGPLVVTFYRGLWCPTANETWKVSATRSKE